MNVTRAVTVLTGEFSAFYTSLGAFKPQRARTFVPYAERIAHKPRRAVSVRRSPVRALLSALREVADSAVGYFLTYDDAPVGRHALPARS